MGHGWYHDHSEGRANELAVPLVLTFPSHRSTAACPHQTGSYHDILPPPIYNSSRRLYEAPIDLRVSENRVVRYLSLFSCVAWLCSCAPTIRGQSENSVVLGCVNQFNSSSDFDTAQRHCQKYGKNAKT